MRLASITVLAALAAVLGPQAALAAGASRVTAPEALEDAVQVFRRDRIAVVGHRQRDPALARRHDELDARVRDGMPHGIRQRLLHDAEAGRFHLR